MGHPTHMNPMDEKEALEDERRPHLPPVYFGPDSVISPIDFKELVCDLLAFQDRMRAWENGKPLEPMKLEQWFAQIRAFNELRRPYSGTF